MGKYFFLILSTVLISCNDGDLEIETINFDSITTVQNCGTINVTGTNVVFKINDDEALIIELADGLIKNEVTETELESAVPGNTRVTYRIFSDNVSTAYFCDAVPPIEPVVTEEIEAQAGTVLVNTVAVDAETFEHTIRLSGISFVMEDGSRITNLQINEFGKVTTKL
ncbi:hypothetical protein [Maribacter sp. 2304DJ31-5]|uniref:hypothetical protein n=1 Tax=Maribacter sp. 2304DJ31-5 TaxID=3386273 RepID=UPI0039BC3A95